MRVFITLIPFFVLAACTSNERESKSPILNMASGKECVDVSGTYRTHFENVDSAGLPEGIIKVKQLSKNYILVEVTMQNGAPSLRSGWFQDSLLLKGCEAEITTAEEDGSCKIKFHFQNEGILVEQQSDRTEACGFAAGVSVNGFFVKEANDSILEEGMD